MLIKAKNFLPVLLITALPTQVRAGHGTIRETDTQIIIEYTGDANDKPVESSGPQWPAPPAPSTQPPAGQGAAAKAQQEEARIKQETVLKSQEEATAAASNREQQATRSPRRSRGASNNQE